MRIDRLDLTAFGPFTEVSLDLSAGARGLHVVFGPNEAGKSSALRAIAQLFRGIPHQSTDDFVHKYNKIRIGALLRGEDGDAVGLVRRKGVKQTLMGPDGAPVADRILVSLLGGTPAEEFTRRFVLDHDELVAGGRDLVEGRGELGRALFAAGGGGLARVGDVRRGLEKEAEGLFLPRGSKPTINADLTELERFRKELRDKALPSSDWVRHDTALREAQERREEIEADREVAERERNRLLRIAEAVGPVARRLEVLEELSRLAGAPRLSSDFGRRLGEARSMLPSSRRADADTRRRLKELSTERDRLEVPQPLLDHAEAIESLHSRLGRVRQADADRERLEVERDRLASEVREALLDLGRDPAETSEILSKNDDRALGALRVTKIDRASLDDLIARFASIPQALEAARKARDELDGRRLGIAARQAAIGQEQDLSALRKAIKEARQAGDLDGSIREAREALERDEDRASTLLDALGFWSGPIEGIDGLAVPSVESVEDAHSRFEAIDREAADLARQQGEAEAADRSAGSDLERLRLEGDVPTEEGLTAVRKGRDSAWRRLRTSWDDTLADTFEAHSRAADEAADRLRREADRVASRARLLAERARLAELQDDLARRIASVESRREQASKEWSNLWRRLGVTSPGEPRTMLAWLRKQGELARLASGIREARKRLKRSEEQSRALRQTLAKGLLAAGDSDGDPEEPLADRLDRAERAMAEARSKAEERARLLAERERLDDQRPALEQAVGEALGRHDDWQRGWAKALARFGLPAEAPTAALSAVLTRSAELFDRIEKARARRRDSEALAAEVSAFAAEVQALVARVAPDLLGPTTPTGAWPSRPWGFDDPGLARSATAAAVFLPETRANPQTEAEDLDARPDLAATLASELYQRLRKAQSARQTFEHLTEQIDKQKEEAHSARSEVQSLRETLAALRREARLDEDHADDDDEQGLTLALASDGRRRERESQRDAIEETLRKLAAGVPLEAFAREVAEADPDALAPRIDRLTERIGELQRDSNEVNQTIGRESSELARMKGGSDAAEISQHAESLRAKIKADLEQYTRLRLAAAVLRAGMERYRKKAQGPVLERATATFARLTLGSFQELRIDHDDRDEPVLRAIRPDGEIVGVEGMSLGTADQLFLALRLATLETFLDRHEPLPIIIDDILIQFDDARAAATLEVLAGLSSRTQILLFTHHAHLIDLARDRVAPGVLFTHALPGRPT